MARTYPEGFDNSSMELFYAVELEFDNGTVRLWNGTHDAQIENNTYIGSGSLLSISDIEETGEVAARGATVNISGLESSIVSVALQENYQNRPARILFGTVSGSTFTAYTLFRGRMDVMSINDSGSTADISITIENSLIDLERSRTYRYTSEDQKALYPNDLGLDYVADLQDKQILWGRS